ncbi:hemoblobin-interacting domain-containing protein [Calidifontibacillus oryziterrae]|uniref:hemoblobin-interacting domain-containing protein n=1 Tax=Calidifontibacillus oryziterrae TaxID=1191699 RepID=UPI000310DE85|nr:hypothetical protein [Calidifontibacillus oryziterrae]
MDIPNHKELTRLIRKIVVWITVIVFLTPMSMPSSQVEYVYAASEAIQNLEDPSAADDVMGSKMTTANSTTPDTIRVVNTTSADELPTLTYQPQSTIGTPLEITYTGGDDPPALTADGTKNDTVTPLEISYSVDANGWADVIEYISAYNVNNDSTTEIHTPNFEIDKTNRIIKINPGILPLGYYTITIHATNFKNADVMQKVNEPMPPKLTADTTDNYGDQPIEITFEDDGMWGVTLQVLQ